MALRNGYAKRETIPHEPDEWMELRLLGWQQLDEARRARQGEAFANIKLMGSDVYKTMQEVRADLGPQAAAQDDPLQTYDLATVLRLGVQAWSYDAPVNGETLGLLDRETAEWAARIIIGAAPESEAERKNGFAPSTSP